MNRKSIIGIMMMKLLDLFSGIGGFSLGMEATKKIKTIAFCEKDEFCRKVLKKHWSNIKQYNDIRSINGKEIAADIISGGVPCQPFSVAGKRKGTEDNRYLWPQMFRVITEVKPRWVVVENVQGIININNGLVLRQVQTDLEAQGFQVQCFLIPASGIGAWHRRNRVWIVAANSNDTGDRTSKHETNEEGEKINERWQGQPQFKSSGYSSTDVAHTDTGFSNAEKKEIQTRGNTSAISSKDVSNSNSRLRRGRGTEQESRANEIWGFYPTQEEQTRQHIRSKTIGCDAISEQAKSWWQTQSELCGVPNGISYELDKDRANRIKTLGNAIVPQIAYEIGQAILKAEYE